MISLEDIQQKRVLVMGLGQNQGGVGSAAFFARHGARVIVTDLKTERELKLSLEQLAQYPQIEYILGQHREQDFQTADLVIKNPAVPLDSPYLEIARKSNIPIESDISLFFKWCAQPIIGITGTKGKTTTTSLVSECLKQEFPSVITAGNLQVSVLEELDRLKPESKILLELSSFALETLEQQRKSPHISAFTNFFEDHMNRYEHMEDYFRAKSHIYLYQSPDDYCVLNYASELVRKHAAQVPSNIIWFAKSCPDKQSDAAEPAHVCVKENQITATGFLNFDHTPIFSLADFQLPGEHNVENALAATAVSLLAGVTPAHIKKAMTAFTGVPFRMEKRGVYHGITFMNDTASTVPESTIRSLESIKESVVLISGGSDKRLDIKKLAQGIVAHTTRLVLLPGNATSRLKLLIDQELVARKKQMDMALVETMSEAVDRAVAYALPGSVVLLSPGLTSFGLFQNEFDRGRQFNKEVERLTNVSTTEQVTT